jgi:hypothetical protein
MLHHLGAAISEIATANIACMQEAVQPQQAALPGTCHAAHLAPLQTEAAGETGTYCNGSRRYLVASLCPTANKRMDNQDVAAQDS